ncbi:MAG: 2-dehydro-3-deoxygalactonokinase, partial [Pseudomonadota bacterium]
MTAGADKSGVALVLADWGTSNLRAWALDNDGSVVATNRSGAGMRTLNRDEFALVLEACAAELGGGADTPAL